MEIKLDYTLLRQMGIVADDAATLVQEDALEQQHVNAIATIGRKIGDNLEGTPIVTSAVWSPGSADDYTATIITVSQQEAREYIEAINIVGANSSMDRQHEYQPVIDAFESKL